MEEKTYRRDLLAAAETLRSYSFGASKEISRVERNLKGLSQDDQDLLIQKPDAQVAAMRSAMQTNQDFLCRVSTEAQRLHDECTGEPAEKSARINSGPAVSLSKQASRLLRHFAREWSAEGLEERGLCFTMIMTALEKYVPISEGCATAPHVIFPQCRLLRLPIEIGKKGYHCEGTESSFFFYIGGELLRRGQFKAEEIKIQPYVMNTCNRMQKGDHVREVLVPEVSLADLKFPNVTLGAFISIYQQSKYAASCDAIVSAYALDSSVNVFRFIRTVAHSLKVGGAWINWGPLDFNASDDEAHAWLAIEMSWEEVRHAISQYFDIKEEGFYDAFIATDKMSMMRKQFEVIFFAAIRNDKPCAPPEHDAAAA